MMRTALKPTCTVLVAALVLSACATGGSYVQSDQSGNPTEQQNRTGRGAAIGAAIGAAAGLLSGHSATKRRQRAMLGVGIGALAGAAIGNYQDRQERALRERTANTGIDVKRDGDKITLNLPDGITFDFGKATLKPQFYGALKNVASTLREYNQTMIEVVGYTDSIGSDAVNQRLSEDRAGAVANYLTGQGVQRERMETSGMGKRFPIADNSTEAGRSKNRRVEIHLIPLTAENSGASGMR
ncbi:OmpA family protein [Xylella taiwanensis]|uniref:Cell envelope biogenesis protein OmpA n=1 Tax=Xylella taiwanensis TaxID=1444770 RepID=Z9JLK6_9GAMM|nr:OmpA family protein [Xylella taiwanensis]AXI84177.1 cell envelope biogenesis protein OmpA [Xylella taiwanensis]EWS78873.1 cell envelope biogenesis protein OmpA [Xylella taiwanensis]MCD8457296.1 OmpA family protein [Xylella taiwanensis]MCD8459706.1 OmpA family protein [Xylella taiwanensis]MCD8461424.1 OmpA family protein [Xylella taiwanensis]